MNIWWVNHKQTWKEEFYRYIDFSLPTMGVAAFAMGLGGILFSVGVLPGVVRLGTTTLLLFALALATYWAWRGWLLSGQAQYRNTDETRWARFRRSSTTQISVLMLTAMAGSACFFALNAGHTLWSSG